MCGIFGGHADLLNPSAIDLLRHRGPDQQGIVSFPFGETEEILVGATRLNIVDKRDIEVPMVRDGAAISYNGEIYNWRDLRRELESEGVTFSTNTDTEVVLQAYLNWGAACLPKFNGQFAIAIFDGKEIWLARDRVGKKPLYYSMKDDRFSFASEMKAFRNLQYEPIDLCEQLEFYFNEFTPFSDVFSLPPGAHLKWRPDKPVEIVKWWEFPRYKGDITCLDDATDEFLSILTDSCRLRQMADVPVTLFLSGGLDSTLLQLVCRFDQTYTIQFDEFRGVIDEQSLVSDFAELLGFTPRTIVPTQEDFDRQFTDLARAIEYPVGSFSIFPLFILAQAAARDGYKVAFSGEGSDELFNGYYRNTLLMQENDHVEGHLAGPYNALCRKYFGSGSRRVARMAQRRQGPDLDRLAEVIEADWDDGEPFCHNLARFETTVAMQPLLTMADRMSMANSLEVRNPFLDYRIVEFSVRIHEKIRRSGVTGKLVVANAVRRLAQSYGRPKLLDREYKHGLPAPINQWLFGADGFERGSWNSWLIRECMHEMMRINRAEAMLANETQAS